MNQALDVGIIGGLGHVGLPFGLVLADSGLQVGLYDIDENKRSIVSGGSMPFLEDGADILLERTLGKSLHILPDLGSVASAKTLVITTGTPVDEYLNPKMLPMIQLAEELLPFLTSDQLILLRSTVYPGTSRRIHEFLQSRGADVHLAFCPERVVQGRAVTELGSMPQIVAGLSEEAVSRAESLFGKLGVPTVHVEVDEAELAKLFTNAWRYLQFAIANHFYMIAREHGADYSAVYRAMTEGYERARDFPGPGFAAGPCLLKDTLQLSAFNRNRFQLGQAAVLVNEGLPDFVADMLERDLGRSLHGLTVGILGMAFKADSDDTRDALSFKLLKILTYRGASVLCSDEYAHQDGWVTKEELMRDADVVIIGVPHSGYRELAVPAGVHLVDLWSVVGSFNP